MTESTDLTESTEQNIEEFIQNTEEEVTYSEILANLSLNNELIIVIPIEQEQAVKTGLKNLKAKQAFKQRHQQTDGIVPVEETLEFISSISAEFEDCIKLHIVLKKKGAIRVKKMYTLDNTL